MKLQLQSDTDIIMFENGDGFCKTRCPKSKSDIGDCFCAHLKWMKLNSGISSAISYIVPKKQIKIDLSDIKLEFEPSHVERKSKHPVTHRYSRKSQAYKSMRDGFKKEYGF